jgi:uncharacterized protein (TIGR02466 family)
MNAAPRMAFNGVWPTLLVKRQLPGHEQPTADLIAHIYEQDAREADYTVRFLEQDFFASGRPGVSWLKQQVEQTATAFLGHVGITRALTWKTFGWYNINRYGDHHGPHTHPKSYLSGTYYARVPPVAERLGDPGAQPACISFHDPRNGANMLVVGTEPDARSTYTVRPTAGTLMMWPSPMLHQVHPNLSEEHRITISFNLSIERIASGS